MTHFWRVCLLICTIPTSSLLGQQKTKIIKEPGLKHFLDKDYSDTLYTYLDEHNRKMDYNSFWIKQSSEMYALRIISEKGKQTIKQLVPQTHHKLIGTKINFDSLDYSLIGKTANDYKGKKVALISFWGGCSGCLMLDEDIKPLEKKYPDIVFVHMTMAWKSLPAYKEKHHIGDIILLPERFDPVFLKAFASAAPMVFFINEQSEIMEIQVGARRDFIMKAYDEKLKRL